jgi:hypothetical protein
MKETPVSLSTSGERRKTCLVKQAVSVSAHNLRLPNVNILRVKGIRYPVPQFGSIQLTAFRFVLFGFSTGAAETAFSSFATASFHASSSFPARCGSLIP